MESGLLKDGVLAQDVNQASSFWRIREVFIKLGFICNTEYSFCKDSLDMQTAL